jgi:hypothetical protein
MNKAGDKLLIPLLIKNGLPCPRYQFGGEEVAAKSWSILRPRLSSTIRDASAVR